MSFFAFDKGLPQLGNVSKSLSLLVLVLATLLLQGCRQLQLPSIDPNGRCLFLPLTNTTQIEIPTLPTPAYQEPVAPPPCVGPNCEPGGVCNLFHRKNDCLSKIHDHFRSPGKKGELQMTPIRVVAPVGGEVVLLAGICGDDGYLVRREPLEWMLAPDSVGQIIEVNDDAPGRLSSLLHPHRPKVQKLGVDFAKGRTSAKPQIIDRGTPNCEDDIHLRDGETWVSVSSPTAGITRVTALAPESKIWDRRRQTAVIYWVDAQWEFPPPQILKADLTGILRTKVTKSEGFVPATGWIVQYTIVEPAIARFLDGPPELFRRIDERTVRTIVDPSGFGSVQLAAVQGAMGTTPVIIEVLSPAQPNDNLPELPIARGQTFMTFSAAGLQLQALGPDLISKGEIATFSATLANPGDLNADNTQLLVRLPAGLRFLNANKQPSRRTDSDIAWDQGVLPANRQLDISFTAEAIASGVYDVTFEAEANGISPIRKPTRIEIGEPTVDVRFSPAGGRAQAEIGETVLYEIDLLNTGRTTVTNLLLQVRTSPGLVETSSGSNEVKQMIPVLRPGENRKLGVPLRVQQEGQQLAQLQVLVGNSVLVTREANILGQQAKPRQPDIGVEILFPVENPQLRTLRVGDRYNARITLRNSGLTTLTNLNVQIATDGNVLRFIAVDPGNSNSAAGGGGNVTWSPANILPGEGVDRVRVLELKVEAIAPAPPTSINVLARSAEGVEATATTRIEIRDDRLPGPSPAFPNPNNTQPVLPSPNNAPNNNPNPGSVVPDPNLNSPMVNPSPNNQSSALPPLTGRLELNISDFNDPQIVGGEIRYLVRIANRSNRVNKAQLEIRVSDGAELIAVSSEGSTVSTRRGVDGAILIPSTTIESFRVGEEIAYTIYLRSRIPQVMRVEALLRSDLFPNPERATETTVINTSN